MLKFTLLLIAATLPGCTSLYFHDDVREQNRFVRKVFAEFNTPIDFEIEQYMKEQDKKAASRE